MKKVYFTGPESIIHEPTGLLLQIGENLVASDEMADQVIADGTCVAEAEPVTPPAEPPAAGGTSTEPAPTAAADAQEPSA